MLTSTPLQDDKAVKVCRAYFYVGFLFLPWLWGMGWIFFRHFLEEDQPSTACDLDGQTGSAMEKNSCTVPDRETTTTPPAAESLHGRHHFPLPTREEEEKDSHPTRTPERKRGSPTPVRAQGVVGLSTPLTIREEEVEKKKESRMQKKQKKSASPSRSSSPIGGMEEKGKNESEPKEEHTVGSSPLSSRSACREDGEAKKTYSHERRRRRKSRSKNETMQAWHAGEHGIMGKEDISSVAVVVVDDAEQGGGGEPQDARHRQSQWQDREDVKRRQQAALRWYVFWSRNLFLCSILLFILMNTIFYLVLPPSSPFWGDDFAMRWWEELTRRKFS